MVIPERAFWIMEYMMYKDGSTVSGTYTNWDALIRALKAEPQFCTEQDVRDFYTWNRAVSDQYVGPTNRPKTIQALRALWGGIQMVRADDDVPDLV